MDNDPTAVGQDRPRGFEAQDLAVQGDGHYERCRQPRAQHHGWREPGGCERHQRWSRNVLRLGTSQHIAVLGLLQLMSVSLATVDMKCEGSMFSCFRYVWGGELSVGWVEYIARSIRTCKSGFPLEQMFPLRKVSCIQFLMPFSPHCVYSVLSVAHRAYFLKAEYCRELSPFPLLRSGMTRT